MNTTKRIKNKNALRAKRRSATKLRRAYWDEMEKQAKVLVQYETYWEKVKKELLSI